MVVVCHVILDHKNPLYLDNPELRTRLQHFCISIDYLPMPLFTVISGFVYALSPATAANAVSFVLARARRLLVPFVFVTTLVVSLRGLLQSQPGTDLFLTIIDSLIHPIAHLWFLPSIFLCILTVGLLDLVSLLANIPRWFVCLGVMLLLQMAYFQTHPFGIDSIPVSSGFAFLLPYFTLGCGLNRFGGQILSHRQLWSCAGIVAVGLVYQQLLMTGSLPGTFGKETPAGLLVGLAATTLLIQFRPKISWLAVLGNYSFSIYLYHFLFISIVLRIPFPDGGTGHAQLFARILGGLLLPILVENIFKRYTITRRIGLGLR